jgi:hypothetical protein
LAGCCECGDEPSGSGATELFIILYFISAISAICLLFAALGDSPVCLLVKLSVTIVAAHVQPYWVPVCPWD